MSSRSCYSISENSGSGFCPSSLKEFGRKRSGNGGGLVVAALAENNNNLTRTGLVFQPFEEVKSDSFVVPSSGNVSLARDKYADESEAAINEQINCRQSCEGSDGSRGKASSESKQGRTCS